MSSPTESQAPEPGLESLPKPRRPGKRVTLVGLALTAVAAVAFAWSLAGEAGYALHRGSPVDAGDLSRLQPGADRSNTWVRGEAALDIDGAIRYSRPMDQDTFRLARVAGNPGLWVEFRIPAGLEGPRFVPPTSFVGRLVPVSGLGVRHRGLTAAAGRVLGTAVAGDAWLLIDGEDPASLRWSLGLVAMLLGFAGFGCWGILRLLRPVER